ncbi:MAG: BrnT family toxin [Myxococcota bacterium]
MRFIWDPKKAASNVRKHRVRFDEAVTVFADPLAVVVSDSIHEDRSLILGQSAVGRLLVVVFAEPEEEPDGEGELRVISARRATKHERRRYEEDEED